MHRRGKRGVSAGTLLMSVITLMVLAGTGYLLARLSGGTDLHTLPATVLQEIPLVSGAPEAVAEIPIQPETEESTASVTSPPKGGRVALDFTGSVALETSVRQSGYHKTDGTYDFSDILLDISSVCTGQITTMPLENLILPSHKVSDLVAPEDVCAMLVSGGADQVTLGFSKAFDLGSEGIDTTVLSLQGAGLETMGAYRSEGDAALSQRIRSVGNLRIAFLAYTQSLSDSGKKAVRKTERSFAVPLLEQAEKDIPVVRSMGADLVVVCIHWGSVGQTSPTKAQRETAQALADAGADLIVGTGSRRVQTAEMIDTVRASGRAAQVLCAYDLGSLLSSSTKSGALESALLHVTCEVSAEGDVRFASITCTPTYQWRYRSGSLYVYRILRNLGEAPEEMSQGENTKMKKAREHLETVFANTPVRIAE